MSQDGKEGSACVQMLWVLVFVFCYCFVFLFCTVSLRCDIVIQRRGFIIRSTPGTKPMIIEPLKAEFQGSFVPFAAFLHVENLLTIPVLSCRFLDSFLVALGVSISNWASSVTIPH